MYLGKYLIFSFLRLNQRRLRYKIRPRNRISKNVMKICGDVNSINRNLNLKHFLADKKAFNLITNLNLK